MMEDNDEDESPRLIVPPSGRVTAHCFRLRPGEQLMASLKQTSSVILSRLDSTTKTAFVITCVGSVHRVTLRLANSSKETGNDIKKYNEKKFEIVSLTGTFSRDDGCHVHICLADAEGNAVGGHLIEAEIFTTGELVLGTADNVEFRRKMDDETGYNELEVSQMATKREFWKTAGGVALVCGLGMIMSTRLRPSR